MKGGEAGIDAPPPKLPRPGRRPIARKALRGFLLAALLIVVTDPLLRKIGQSSPAYIRGKILEQIDEFSMFVEALAPGRSGKEGTGPDPNDEPATRRMSLSLIRMMFGPTLPVRLNKEGFRDDEFDSIPRGPNTYRVVFCGDSWTWGMGVAGGERFVDILKSRLIELHTPYDIQTLDMGVQAVGSRVVLDIVRRYALPRKPDLLVLSPGSNDLRLSRLAARRGESSNGPVVAGARYFLGSLELVHALRFGMRRFGILPPPSVAETEDSPYSPAEYGANARAAIRLAREQGVPTVVWAYDIALQDIGLTPYRESLARVAREEEVPFVDTAAKFHGEQAPEGDRRRRFGADTWISEFIHLGVPEDRVRKFFLDPDLFVDYLHPSPAGHALIADALLPVIVDQLSLPKKASP